jgi:cysteine-rich repeat protein
VDGSQECADGNAIGGDGCAANCTAESAHAITLDASRSGIAFQTKFVAIPRIPLSGQLTLRVGRARETSAAHETPLAVRAGDLRIDPIPVSSFACLCLLAIEDPALGEGIAGSGTVSCSRPLVGDDVSSSIDTSDVDPAEVVTTSGEGPPGSARLDLRVAGRNILGTCAVETSTQICDRNGCVPAKGADGIPCTADDPVPGTSTPLRKGESSPTGAVAASLVSQAGRRPRSGIDCGYEFLPSQFTLRLTTGTARAEIHSAGTPLGGMTTQATGAVLDCSALGQPQGNDLASGALAAAFVALDGSCLGDEVGRLLIGLASCIGDCDGDGSVTVDELIRGVNIALGSMSLDDCPSFHTNRDDQVTVDDLIAAVNVALNGCGL